MWWLPQEIVRSVAICKNQAWAAGSGSDSTGSSVVRARTTAGLLSTRGHLHSSVHDLRKGDSKDCRGRNRPTTQAPSAPGGETGRGADRFRRGPRVTQERRGMTSGPDHVGVLMFRCKRSTGDAFSRCIFKNHIVSAVVSACGIAATSCGQLA